MDWEYVVYNVESKKRKPSGLTESGWEHGMLFSSVLGININLWIRVIRIRLKVSESNVNIRNEWDWFGWNWVCMWAVLV